MNAGRSPELLRGPRGHRGAARAIGIALTPATGGQGLAARPGKELGPCPGHDPSSTSIHLVPWGRPPRAAPPGAALSAVTAALPRLPQPRGRVKHSLHPTDHQEPPALPARTPRVSPEHSPGDRAKQHQAGTHRAPRHRCASGGTVPARRGGLGGQEGHCRAPGLWEGLARPGTLAMGTLAMGTLAMGTLYMSTLAAGMLAAGPAAMGGSSSPILSLCKTSSRQLLLAPGGSQGAQPSTQRWAWDGWDGPASSSPIAAPPARRPPWGQALEVPHRPPHQQAVSPCGCVLSPAATPWAMGETWIEPLARGRRCLWLLRCWWLGTSGCPPRACSDVPLGEEMGQRDAWAGWGRDRDREDPGWGPHAHALTRVSPRRGGDTVRAGWMLAVPRRSRGHHHLPEPAACSAGARQSRGMLARRLLSDTFCRPYQNTSCTWPSRVPCLGGRLDLKGHGGSGDGKSWQWRRGEDCQP